MAKHFAKRTDCYPHFTEEENRVTRREATCQKSPPKLAEGELDGILKLLACLLNTRLKF